MPPIIFVWRNLVVSFERKDVPYGTSLNTQSTPLTFLIKPTSDVARKGHGATKLPSCPQTISFEKMTSFWLHLRLMYPQNVTICHIWGIETPKNFLLASLAALFCTPIFIVVALSVIATLVEYCDYSNYSPLKFLSPPNRHNLATCLKPTSPSHHAYTPSNYKKPLSNYVRQSRNICRADFPAVREVTIFS